MQHWTYRLDWQLLAFELGCEGFAGVGDRLLEYVLHYSEKPGNSDQKGDWVLQTDKVSGRKQLLGSEWVELGSFGQFASSLPVFAKFGDLEE